MRVALFTDTYPPDVNGVAKTLERWVRYLESRGAACKVFAPQAGSAVQNDPISVERFYSIPFALYPECRMAIPNPIHMNKTLKAFRPTIIHVATPFNLGLLGHHYAKKHRIPLVASYHTHFDQYLQYYKLQWMEPMLWKYMLWFHKACRKIYVPSMSTLRHVESKGLRNLEIWSRGIDAGRFRPQANKREVLSACGIDPDKFIVLYVGRLAAEKNIDVLMETIQSVPEEIQRMAHFIVAGDGPLYASLNEQYKRENVTFPGYVQGKTLADLYAAADLFLFPSATETFGNVVLEAMASGLPVIGAAAGGVADIVQHGTTGILCEPGNADSFVQAVEHLVKNPDLRRSLAANARQYSLRQSWDEVLGRLYQSFEEISGLSATHNSRTAAFTG
jgi:glycosyltransferase involved in cell wall biosynthesis